MTNQMRQTPERANDPARPSATDDQKDELATIIFEMDEPLNAIVNLAEAVAIMGCSTGTTINAAAVYQVGEALREKTEAVQAQWRQALALSRPGARA